MSSETPCYAVLSPSAPLQPYSITRRPCGDDDVVIDIKYAGICHSDIHQARTEWGDAIFPMVPGHEIGGIVAQIGAKVTKFQVGDVVGVGCMVDSCRSCEHCIAGLENYCDTGMVGTYNSRFKYPHCAEYDPASGGAPTYGGYSRRIVVTEHFVCRIPSNLDLAAATPLLCAGVTVFSPMMHYGLKPTHKFAVAGMGGLGHMAVKFGVALCCDTTVVSRGSSKKEHCLRDLGAHHYIDSTSAEELKANARTFDFIIFTISAECDFSAYLNLLKTDGKFIVVGAPPKPVQIPVFAIIPTRRTIAGSMIGGVKETQDMLDFCGRHNIVCDIEKITADQINEAYDRAVAGDVKYRFVIDADTF